MPQSHPLALFYQAGPDFNYLNYLETQSHYDQAGARAEAYVDSRFRSLLYSNEDLAKKNIAALKGIENQVERSGDQISEAVIGSGLRIESAVQEGFDRLSFDVQQVGASVNSLAAICEIGFSEIGLELSTLNRSVDELVRVTKSQTRTRAEEQYEMALDAFRRHLYSRALLYTTNAIEGYDGQSGFDMDHRFYLLRGRVRLGNQRNFDPEIVNPEAAAKDFLNAAMFAEHVDKAARAEAYQLAGWAYYCADCFGDSKTAFFQSIEVNPDDPTTRYLLAKILYHLGEEAEAELHFSKSIRHDHNFIMRAGGDEDFIENWPSSERIITEYRQELASQVRELVPKEEVEDLFRWEPLVDKYYDAKTRSNLEIVRSQIDEAQRASITRLKEIRTSLNQAFLDAKRDTEEAEQFILKELLALRSQKPETFEGGPLPSQNIAILELLSMVVTMLVPVIWIAEMRNVLFSGSEMVVGVLIAAWLIPGFLLGMVAGRFCARLLSVGPYAPEFRQIEQERTAFEERERQRTEKRERKIATIEEDLSAIGDATIMTDPMHILRGAVRSG